MTDNENNLYVPVNITLRNEVWPGFSVNDAVVTLLVLAVSAGIGVLCAVLLHIPLFFCVLGSLLPACFCVALLTREPNSNLSPYEQLKIMAAFSKSQKSYDYVYLRKGETQHGRK